jgi:hypothetical protein
VIPDDELGLFPGEFQILGDFPQYRELENPAVGPDGGEFFDDHMGADVRVGADDHPSLNEAVGAHRHPRAQFYLLIHNGSGMNLGHL